MGPKMLVVSFATFLLLVAVATASASVYSSMNPGVSLMANLPHPAGVALISSSLMIGIEDRDHRTWRSDDGWDKNWDKNWDKDRDKDRGRGRDWDKDKDKKDKNDRHRNQGIPKNEFHGAEMTPGTMLLAGILGILAYLGIRRYSHRHV